MKKSEMNTKQRALRNAFITNLTDNGWDAIISKNLFDEDYSLYPEVTMEYQNEQVLLRCSVFIVELFIKLEICKRDITDNLILRLHFTDDIKKIISGIISLQETLNIDNIMNLIDVCLDNSEKVLLEDNSRLIHITKPQY
jgi:hypothetical protein